MIGAQRLTQLGDTTPPLMAVSSRAFVNNFAVAITAGKGQAQTRYFFFLAGAPVTELRLVYCNWQNGEVASGAALTVEAAIELDAPFQAVRVTFGGANTYDIPSGGQVISDPVYPGEFDLAAFPANSRIWVRTGGVTTGNWCYANQPRTADGEAAVCGTAPYTSQILGVGAFTAITGQAAISSGGPQPSAILGRTTVAIPSVVVIGDSIGEYINDTTTPILFGNGFVGRGLGYAFNGNAVIPYINISCGGDGMVNWDSGTWANRRALMQYATHAICELGVNDMKSGGSTAAVALTNARKIWADTKAAGVRYVFQTTITPYATSTDSWATAANQTDLGHGADLRTFNASVRSEVNSNLDGYIEIGNTLRDAVLTDAWLTDGNAGTYTSDGLHPTSAGHQLVAGITRAAIQSRGKALADPDYSWVRGSALTDLDFKNSNYYGTNRFEYLTISTQIARSEPTTMPVTSASTLLSFPPTTRRIVPGVGLFIWKNHVNLFASPFSPATQTVTVVNGTTYTVSCYGTGSITLSGASSLTVTAGSPATFAASGTSLTATVSGNLIAMQCEANSYFTGPFSGTSNNDLALINTADLQGTAGTIVITCRAGHSTSVLFGQGSAHNTRFNSTTTILADVNGANGITATLGSGTCASRFKVGLAFDASGRSLCGNAGTIVTNATALGTHNAWNIGGLGINNNFLDDVIERVTVWNIRLSDATLQAETALTF